jgi:ABC-type branched-subunit amino acid transport system substrate-binding protein
MNTEKRFSSFFVGVITLAVILACQLLPVPGPEAPTPIPVSGIGLPTPEPASELSLEETVISQDILIAVQGPVTGQLSAYYPHLRNTVEMAILEEEPLMRDRLGRVPKMVEVDDRCEGPAGASAAEQLITAHPDVLGVIGPLCSGAASESLPIYTQVGLVSISGSATREDLSTLFGSGGYFYRTVFNEAQMRELGRSENSIDDLPDVQDFYTRYESQYGPIPEEIRPLMAYTYDATGLLLIAVEKVAVENADGTITLERAALAQAVRRGLLGITGAISFEEDGDRVPFE